MAGLEVALYKGDSEKKDSNTRLNLDDRILIRDMIKDHQFFAQMCKQELNRNGEQTNIAKIELLHKILRVL